MKYKSKDITINAIEWDSWGLERVKDFIGDREYILTSNGTEMIIDNYYSSATTVRVDDYLIKDENGDIYSCSRELLNMLFEEVKE